MDQERVPTEGTEDPAEPALRGWWRWVTLGLFGVAFFLFHRHAEAFEFVCDDAFISYRYSKHFAEGLGLVWNPGQVVEGYTSFLWIWVGVLAFKLGIAPEVLSLFITRLAGYGVLGLVCFYGWKRRPGSPWAALAPLLLSVNRTFAAWSSGGLATQLFSFLALGSVLLFLFERRRGPAGRIGIGSALCFALATWTRPEGVLFATAAGLIALTDVIRGRKPLSKLVLWAAIFWSLVLAQVFWRHSFYGYWLPNTYYAKVGGLRLDEAVLYMRIFSLEYGLLWFLPLVFVPAIWKRRAQDLLLLYCLILFSAYVLYVGGDWMEFRFMNAPLPYLCLLLAEGLALLAGSPAQLGRRTAQLRLVAALVAAGWLFSNTLETVLRDKFPRGRSISDVRINMSVYSSVRRAQGEKLREWVEKGLLPEDLRIAVGGAGALPYFSELYTVDMLGWNDTYISHLPPVERGRIGHEHAPPFEYLQAQRVDVIDALNTPIRTGDPATFPRSIEKPYYQGSLRCLEVEPGWYLVFATAISEEDFERRLGHLRRVF